MTSSSVGVATAPSWGRRHGVAYGARLGALLAAVGAALLEPVPTAALVLVALFAAAASAARPTRFGAAPPLAVLLALWLVGYGTDTEPSLPRTIAFGLVLVVLHECVALASAVPASAFATAALLVRWLAHLVPEALAVVAVAGLVAITGRMAGSPAVDIIGLAAVLGVLAALMWLAYATRPRS